MFVPGLWKHWPVMQSQWSVGGRDFLFHSTTCWYSEESIPTRLIPQWVSEMPTSGDLKSGDFFSDQHSSWSNLPMRPPLQKISFFDLFSPVSTSILKIIPSNHRPPSSVFFPVMPADLPFISRGPYLTGIHRKISGDIRYCFYYVVVPKLHPYPHTFH